MDTIDENTDLMFECIVDSRTLCYTHSSRCSITPVGHAAFFGNWFMKNIYWHGGLSAESFYLITFALHGEESDFVEGPLGYTQPAKLCRSAMKPFFAVLKVCMRLLIM